jgi:hypothetical protein
MGAMDFQEASAGSVHPTGSIAGSGGSIQYGDYVALLLKPYIAYTFPAADWQELGVIA